MKKYLLTKSELNPPVNLTRNIFVMITSYYLDACYLECRYKAMVPTMVK